jgi:hypothetical protein
MNIETIEAFKALKHYGIHAARSKIVDSAEDAIAFAERRDARDPRFMPIVLRSSAPGGGPEPSALQTENAIRHTYEHLVQSAVGKILAQEATEAGTDIAIAGRTDASDGKIIALQSAVNGVERMVPLDSAGAEFLASNFQGHHHHGTSEKARRMLEHLLLRTSAFFEHSGASQFRLTVRLHENSYTVIDASITAPKALLKTAAEI